MKNDCALLREMREASGMSIQAVAVEAELSHQTVWRTLNGQHVADETRNTILAVLRRALEVKHAETGALLTRVA